MDPKQITDLLVQSGALSAQLAQDMVINNTFSSHSQQRIDHLIFEQKLLTRDEFYHGIAKALNIDYYDILNFEPTPETLKLIPPQLARLHGILPLFSTGTTDFVALVDPCNIKGLEDIRFALEKNFEQVLGDIDRVCFLIQSHYGDAMTQKSDLEKIAANISAPPLRVIERDEEHPVIQFVDLILEKAIQSQASDIHLEPFESEFKIRYRVDGTLYEMPAPAPHLSSTLISHVKVLANLNIAERRLPQDGRIQYERQGGHLIDLRVSTLPTAFGESVVIRVLDRTTVQLDLETLGMPDDIYRSVMETIHKPNGIFIITGPTGSGKTTTLYSCLRKINHIDSKFLTVEDPVEYEMEGILQVPVNENIGLNFSRVLRAFLRQDPDCIMLGEIRDRETAQIAIQASLTGHLVFTTLHTNDSIGAITRLKNFGVESFLLSASCEGVLAQRLIRRICPHCRVDSSPPTEFQITSLDLKDPSSHSFYRGSGCKSCSFTGYLGRKGIYEFLGFTNPIRELIHQDSPEADIRKKAVELGMVTLREDGFRSVYSGDSTLEEIMKYC